MGEFAKKHETIPENYELLRQISRDSILLSYYVAFMTKRDSEEDQIQDPGQTKSEVAESAALRAAQSALLIRDNIDKPIEEWPGNIVSPDFFTGRLDEWLNDGFPFEIPDGMDARGFVRQKIEELHG